MVDTNFVRDPPPPSPNVNFCQLFMIPPPPPSSPLRADVICERSQGEYCLPAVTSLPLVARHMGSHGKNRALHIPDKEFWVSRIGLGQIFCLKLLRVRHDRRMRIVVLVCFATGTFGCAGSYESLWCLSLLCFFFRLYIAIWSILFNL